MCIKQELSKAITYAAPVALIEVTLSASIAAEVASFLTEKVPPKPQQVFCVEFSISSIPSTCERISIVADPSRRDRNE